MLPYLTQLTEQFTRYTLGDAGRLNSGYAIRLYELLCQWRDAGVREVSIEWLRHAFMLDGKYPAIKDFKRWVIVPAVEQVNEHTSLWVKWDQRKTGRRVSHLVFTFGEKAPEKSEKTRKGKTQGNAKGNTNGGSGALYGIPRAVIESKARPGESYEDTALRLLDEARSRKALMS